MGSPSASDVLAADRAWFFAHPSERLRFRQEIPGEFSALEEDGHEIPFFLPPGLRRPSSQAWVVVIELSRLMGLSESSDGSSLRVRFRTAPIRSGAMQRRLAPFYEEAVRQDFLLNHPYISAA